MFDTGVGSGGTGIAGVDLRDGLSSLTADLAVLTAVEPADLPGDGLGEVVLALTAHIRQLEAVRAGLADRFSSSGAWAADGARSAETWITGRVNERPGAARSITRLGRSARAYPVMGAALADGLVGAEHLRILAEAHRKYPSIQHVLHEHEHDITRLAIDADPIQFDRELTGLCHRLDPDAVDAEDFNRQSDYHLHASKTLGGAVRVDGLLPPEVGALFLNALEAARRAVKAEKANGEQANGEKLSDTNNPPDADSTGGSIVGEDIFGTYRDTTPPPPTELDPFILTSQRNVDALHRILTAAVDATDETGSYTLPQVNGARPVISITVPLDSLREDSQHNMMGTLERFGVPHATITAASAQRLACDGVISPLIIDREGQIIATLPSVRAVPAHIRKAVISRDIHCRFPHCKQRIDEVHHIIFASHGGDTTMINLTGLCYHHHRLIHHGDWTVEGNANHTLTFTNTTRQRDYTTRPPPSAMSRTGFHRKPCT